MKKQCTNPYLPLFEHIPDGEPHVFGDRLYVFGSHDLENGSEFCELDYAAWSAPVDDLSDWRCEGIIYRKDQDPFNKDLLPLYAPDVVRGPDGRYYLFYCAKFQDSINVAVCDTPAGAYEFYGRVHYADGRIMTDNQPYDPSVICAEEGNFLYFGFAPCMINIPRYKNQDLKGCSAVRLSDDMLTVLEGPDIVLPSLTYGKGTSFEGHEYFEAPSIRIIRTRWYLIYSSIHTHALCYAISTSPMGGFTYGGVIVDNGDVGYKGRSEDKKLMSVGNNHGGLVEVKGQWYMFYHRHTSLNQYNRQGCAERVFISEDGSIPQVTITTSGMNPEPLSGDAVYPAVLCCNLTNGHMGALSSLGRTNAEADFPYITCEDGERYITNIKEGDLIGYKYINLSETGEVSVTFRCDGYGSLLLYTSLAEAEAAQASLKDGAGELPAPVGEIAIEESAIWRSRTCGVSFGQALELYLIYRGMGAADLLTLTLRG